MDVINDALEAAVMAKDKSEWTPVSVNVAPATLTILSKQVREEEPGSAESIIHSGSCKFLIGSRNVDIQSIIDEKFKKNLINSSELLQSCKGTISVPEVT